MSFQKRIKVRRRVPMESGRHNSSRLINKIDADGEKNPNARTLDHYLDSARTLLNGMVRRGWFEAIRLKIVVFAIKKKLSTNKWRTLSDDEVIRLLAASGTRSFVYETILLTGLRRSELASLQWRDLDLETKQPKIVLRAETTKSGQTEVLPLSQALLAGFSALAAQPHDPTDHVFIRLPTMDEVRYDLCAAGIAILDLNGRRADFHVLRYTFCINLHRVAFIPGPYWNIGDKQSAWSVKRVPIKKYISSRKTRTTISALGAGQASSFFKPRQNHSSAPSSISTATLLHMSSLSARWQRLLDITLIIFAIMIILGLFLILCSYSRTAIEQMTQELTHEN